MNTAHSHAIFYSRSPGVRHLAAFNWNCKSFNRQNKCWSESSSQFYKPDPLNGPCMHLALSARTTNGKYLCLQNRSWCCCWPLRSCPPLSCPALGLLHLTPEQEGALCCMLSVPPNANLGQPQQPRVHDVCVNESMLLVNFFLLDESFVNVL